MPIEYLLSHHFPGLKLPRAKNFEANRLASFHNWTNPHVFASSLAKAGFCYKGVGDEAECCFCLGQWSPGNVSRDLLQHHAPHCPLLTGEVLPGVPPNIQLPRSPRKDLADVVHSYLSQHGQASRRGLQEAGGAVSDSRVESVNLLGCMGVRWREPRRGCSSARSTIRNIPRAADGSVAQTAQPLSPEKDDESAGMYPQFSIHSHRQTTFCSFPLGQGSLVKQLCLHGFFFTGHEDIVICYHCGLSLCRWLAGDDPKFSHARWSPNCRHLHTVVSSAFLEAINREMQNIGSAQ